jgi:hypothetical protein
MAESTTLDLFLKLPGSGLVTECIRRYVEVHRLPVEEIGTTWGIVLPKSGRGKVVRINAWSQQLVACVFQPSGSWLVCVATPKSPEIESVTAQFDDNDLSLCEGQSGAMAEQWLVEGAPQTILELMANGRFVSGSGEVVEKVRGRKLWGRHRANAEAGEYFCAASALPAELDGSGGVRPFTPRDENRRIEDLILTLQNSDDYERGLNSHERLTNELADRLRRRNLAPVDPGEISPRWDLGWYDGDRLHIVEVKSLTSRNEVGQLRLGLGQLLHYRWSYQHSQHVEAILYVERKPSQTEWQELCSAAGVTLLWPAIVESWLDSRCSA